MKNIKLFEQFWGTEASGLLPICKTTGRILLGKRSKDVNEPGTWGNFGGAIGLNDWGEDEENLPPKDNALKEFEEETRYNGEIEIIDSFIYENNNFKYYNFIGLVDHEFEAIVDWETEICQWFSLEEVLKHNNLHFGIQALLGNSLDQIKQYTK